MWCLRETMLKRGRATKLKLQWIFCSLPRHVMMQAEILLWQDVRVSPARSGQIQGIFWIGLWEPQGIHTYICWRITRDFGRRKFFRSTYTYASTTKPTSSTKLRHSCNNVFTFWFWWAQAQCMVVGSIAFISHWQLKDHASPARRWTNRELVGSQQ